MASKTANSIQNINVTIELSNKLTIYAGVKDILKIVRPSWPIDLLELKFLTHGLTNVLVQCQSPDDHKLEDVILVRIYGKNTELLIDREEEKRNIILLQAASIAPPLYATFDNGLAYKFVHGCTLSPTLVIVPKIYKLVAAQMAKLHMVEYTSNTFSSNTPILWEKTMSFLELVPTEFSDPEKNSRFKRLYPTKYVILKEISQLRSILEIPENQIVFSHNDLLLGNIIYNEFKSSVTFIDFEYSGCSYQAFDIGNHFAEFIGTEDIDVSNYPSKELQYDWLREYLSVYNSSTEVNESDIHKLYLQVNKFALMAHIFWGIWAFVQSANSSIDFDYLAYGALRFDEYFKKKEIFLSLK